MRVRQKRKGKKTGGSSGRKGSTCELCAHDDDSPCGASCVNGWETPLVTTAACFQRRSPLITTFYCQCAQLGGELHRLLQLPVSETFQEGIVTEIGTKVLSGFKQVLDDATSEDDETPPMCPFVMLLSILLPSLRKHLAWVVGTRPAWVASSHRDSTDGASSALLSMIALHDVIMDVTIECGKVSHLIEMNEGIEGIEGEQQHVRPRPANPSASSGAPFAPTPTAKAPMRIPQIKKISLEFEEVHAEFKIQLAELTESILEHTELVLQKQRTLVFLSLSLSHSLTNRLMLYNAAECKKVVSTDTVERRVQVQRICGTCAAQLTVSYG